MLTTQLPGFSEITRDSQETFRALLEALSQPGKTYEPSVQLTPPKGLTLACAAACLTLLDLESRVWLQPGFSADVEGWLQFHTGCRFSAEPDEVAFAVIHDLSALALDEFSWGSAEAPEASATLLVQVGALAGGLSVMLRGPGILQAREISPEVPASFWTEWQRNHRAYPRGLDVFLFGGKTVMGLPRTVAAQSVDVQSVDVQSVDVQSVDAQMLEV
ncbi:MAG: phosphonate C-P lyase system protein PhnH [Cyanobacteria bacterium J06598_3]